MDLVQFPELLMVRVTASEECFLGSYQRLGDRQVDYRSICRQ
jgi:hypothetical protein